VPPIAPATCRRPNCYADTSANPATEATAGSGFTGTFPRPSRKLAEAERENIMSRNNLYVVIAILLIGVVGLAALYHEERNDGVGIEIVTGDDGISIEANP